MGLHVDFDRSIRALAPLVAVTSALLAAGSARGLDCVHPRGHHALAPLGDVTGNGAVNVADAVCSILVQLWASGGSVGSPPACLAVGPVSVAVQADINCDAAADVSDVLLLIHLALQGSLPAGVPAGPDGCPLACVDCAPPEGSSCQIAGVCVPEAGADPTNSCALCMPGVDDSAYSTAPDGVGCGGGQICDSGACVSTLPGAPTGVALTPGPSSVSVQWSAPAVDGGSAVAHYLVRVLASDGGPATGVQGATERQVDAPATSIDFGGLTAFVPYRFSISAVNAVGPGPSSALSDAVEPFCGPCGPGDPCQNDSDCDSDVCAPTGLCAAAACDDLVQNGSESGVDCGGGCPACPIGEPCTQGSDCAQGVCDGSGLCAAPTCSDGVSNADETGVDCGGPLCDPCAGGQVCVVHADCSAGECGPGADGTCTARLCRPAPLPIDGGTLHCDINGAVVHEVYAYTQVGVRTFTPRLGVTEVEVLVAAGGGGGGSSGESGSGGGAGGLVYYGAETPRVGPAMAVVPTIPISLTVGAGGVGASPGNGTTTGQAGANSSFGDLVARGGGPGVGANENGVAGGSGGGACDSPGVVGGAATQPGSASGGFGHAGGNSPGHAAGGSGGGGAGATGGAGVVFGVSGSGGAGLTYAISGSPTAYAGGGGGGLRENATTAPGAGGLGGGGRGGTLSIPAESGVANSGGGGGGAYGTGSGSTPDTDAGNGGTGVVIVRHPVPPCSYSGTCGLPTCFDLLANGDETGVDCGGPCEPCPAGEGCVGDEDCQSEVCTTGTCAAPTCDDLVANGQETGVDCSGLCEPCELGDGCHAASDCVTNRCGPGVDGTCSTGVCVDSYAVVAGAQISCEQSSGIPAEVHAYFDVGSYTFTPRAGVSAVEVLVVAGGGGGGSSGESGSGGGAGGLIYYGSGGPRLGPAYAVTPLSDYAVTVGAGGQGASVVAGTITGDNGQNSTFGPLVAIGGGRGVGANQSGVAGGSGGGACDSPSIPGGAAQQPGSASGGYGYPGGASVAHATGGSGGGGAGGPGAVPSAGAPAAKGGNGLQYAISGQLRAYAGGGGGGVRQTVNTGPGAGGLGGGGSGGAAGLSGQAGTPMTGGGGGGGSGIGEGYVPDTNGGAGGSGVVIVRFAVE